MARRRPSEELESSDEPRLSDSNSPASINQSMSASLSIDGIRDGNAETHVHVGLYNV